MNEHNYIVATDVRTIGIVEDALRHIMPENNSHVPKDEYRQVMTLLNKWRESLFDEINADPDNPNKEGL